MIFDLLIEGRVVKVHIYKDTIKTTTPMPTLLHFTPESREYALQKYIKLNSYQYFHLELDTLLVGRHFVAFNKDERSVGYMLLLLRFLPAEIIQGLKKLGLACRVFSRSGNAIYGIRRTDRFLSLKSFTWVHNDSLVFEPHHVEFIATRTPVADLIDLDATKAELAVAFDDVGNTSISDGGFVINQVDEVCYAV